MYEALKPVEYWNLLKTKLADCLWSLVARMVMKQTKNAVIFHTRIPFDSLFKIDGRKMLDAVARKAIR